MLKRIYVDNFRSLVNFELALGKVNLLMGGNGSGKTSVLAVLVLLQTVVRGLPPAVFGHSSLTRWQRLPLQTIEVELELRGESYRYTLKIRREHVDQPHYRVFLDATIEEERLSCGDLELYSRTGDSATYLKASPHTSVPFLVDQDRSGLTLARGRADPRLGTFVDWFESLTVVRLHPAKMIAWSAKETRRPSYDLADFASWYRHLIQDRGPEMEEARDALRVVMPGFRGARLLDVGVAEAGRKLVTEWRLADGTKLTYDFDELSDGQRALIALYTVLFAGGDEPMTIAIDEPDNFVALSEIQPWLGALSERPALQALLISHHPEILNMHAVDAGIVFRRDDGGPTRIERFTAEPGETLTPAELVARGWARGTG